MKINPRVTVSLAFCGVLSLGIGALSASAQADDPARTKQESEQPVGDSWITTKVKGELATTEGVKSMDISVKTVNGVVALTGTQADPMAIRKAVAAAEKIKGVRSVDATGLTVASPMKK